MRNRIKKMNLSGRTDYLCPFCKEGMLVVHHHGGLLRSEFIITCTECEHKYRESFGRGIGHDLDNALHAIEELCKLAEISEGKG